MTVYEADWICPISSPPIRNGRLIVVDGKIASSVADHHGSEIFKFPGCAIIPGFVNAHTHLELTILRGFLDDLPFAEWIPRLTRTKYQDLSLSEMMVSAQAGVMEMLRAGVTCVGEVMDLGTAWDAMREHGIQGVAYQEVFGPAPRQAGEALSGLRQKVEKYRQDETTSLRVGVSPHAPYTVSRELYEIVNEYAEREQLRQTTHIAESADEGKFVRTGTGVFADRWRDRGIQVERYGCSPLSYIERLGLLRPETLLIHAVDLDDSDFDYLEQRRPAIVHCPKSNAKLAHGIARIPEMREAGITLALGTDSVASNNVVDMFEEMRAAIFQQRGRTGRLDSLDAQTAFHMATLGGAESLGLSEHLGSLDEGKRADFVVVDLADIAVQPVYDPIQAMVYSASRQNVRATYLAGREVRTDTDDLLKELTKIAARLRL